MSSVPFPFALRRLWQIAPTVLAACSLVLAFTVAGFRIQSAWRVAGTAPGTVETSGCEEESWLSLWNRLHDRPALRLVTEPPFNYAYFNWAFYESYAVVLDWTDAAEHPERILRFGRLLTAAWALGGFIGLMFLLHRVAPPDTHRLVSAFWAGVATFGPLTGWFVTTVRPDLAAITLEIFALACVCRTHRRDSGSERFYVILGALCVYFAWAFKPSFVGVMSGIGLYYLLEQRWRALAWYCAAVWGCTALTFLVGGESYREVILGTVFEFSRFDAATGWGALKHAALGTAPIWSAFLILVVGWKLHRSSPRVPSPGPLERTAIRLGLCCVAVTLPLSALAAFKAGAWSYYYLPVLAPACLLLVGWSVRSTLAPVAVAIAGVLSVGLQGGLLAGAWGSVSREAASLELQSRWQEFSRLPEPRFSEDLRLNLPWLNPGSPAYVLAYDYAALRDNDVVNFEGDGFGGAVRRGEVVSLYLRQPEKTEFDGTSLAEFRREDYPTGFSAHVLREPALSLESTQAPE